MIRRLRQVFNRFLHGRLLLEKTGWPLTDKSGDPIGNIDVIRLEGGRMIVEGWSLSDKMSFGLCGATQKVRPRLPRVDVHALGLDFSQKARGFAVALPAVPGLMSIQMKHAGTRYCFNHPAVAPPEMRRAKLAHVPVFLLRLTQTLPYLLAWRLTGADRYRAQVRHRLGLRASALSPPKLVLGAGAACPQGKRRPITIVMPIFNAFEHMCEALRRVADHTDVEWSIIVVEDCSTDARIAPRLAEWATEQNQLSDGRVTVLSNDTNLGFIGSVNRALKHAIPRGHHVVLLNSDAFVPREWASRLLAPIWAQKRVASVTPMSNDAELLTMPVICRPNTLREGEIDALDAAARRLPADMPCPAMPTGVGFCMAMNIEYLRRVPLFDHRFGRGYGEEVDWCQKARAKGGLHVAQPRLFVEHAGGSSFGSAAKQALIVRNNREIARRYPEFDQEVRDFISQDVLCAARINLGIGQLASQSTAAVSVFIGHSLGGGAEIYLKDRLAREVATRGGALVLRVGGTRAWQLELHTSNGMTTGSCADFKTVQLLLEPLRSRRLIYSCGVGVDDPFSLPEKLLRLGDGGQIEVLFHDYYPISPDYTLMKDRSLTQGLCLSDALADKYKRPGSELLAWRAKWGRVMDAASEIVVFSCDSARIVTTVYPQVSKKMKVRPHTLPVPVGRVRMPATVAGRIGFLGNLNYHKGAGVACELARAFQEDNGPHLVVLGDLAPEYLPGRNLHVHGRYDVKDLEKLVRRYQITAWVIPSIWPETFSYTTHEALATGLPTYVFDIGAQAEAAHAAANGVVVPYGTSRTRVRDLQDALSHEEQRDVA